MRKLWILFVVLILSVTGLAAAENDEGAAQITVVNVQTDPQVMMRGDTGTITVQVVNNGEIPVPISRATLRDNDIIVLDESIYASVGILGAGNTLTFTFTVRADAPDGIYYPKFSLEYQSAPSLRYRIPVKIESSELSVVIIEQPDSFSVGNKEPITVLVGNPRENSINGVSVTAKGEGIDVKQSGFFIGALNPDQSAEVVFEITPYKSSNLTILAEYRNGINPHSAEILIPIEISEGKKRAEPVLNNIELTSEVGYYRITGDVTNAGLDIANSVVITTGPPAEPVDPFRLYVVGSLDSDDFSSFEVTFRAEDENSIPLIIQYKDVDGNSFERSLQVDLEISRGSNDEGAQNPLLIGFVVIIVLIIAGVIFYSWKKK